MEPSAGSASLALWGEVVSTHEGVMAGLVPAIHASDTLKQRQAGSESENLRFYKPLRARAISYSSLRRTGVDDRDKPGHDGSNGFSAP
jgi:hypothetical protein